MKKIPTFLCAVALVGSAAYGATAGYRSIAVKHADHHVSLIAMESDMTTTIADGNLVIICSKGEITFPMTDVRYWKFSTESGSSDQWAVISDVAPDDALIVKWTDSAIAISGMPADSHVSLHSLDGRMVVNRVVTTGECDISTAGLSTGVFILTVNNRSFKVALTR